LEKKMERGEGKRSEDLEKEGVVKRGKTSRLRGKTEIGRKLQTKVKKKKGGQEGGDGIRGGKKIKGKFQESLKRGS